MIIPPRTPPCRKHRPPHQLQPIVNEDTRADGGRGPHGRAGPASVHWGRAGRSPHAAGRPARDAHAS
eukprot:4698126-Alexandrium_andersonii.AAC.1